MLPICLLYLFVQRGFSFYKKKKQKKNGFLCSCLYARPSAREVMKLTFIKEALISIITIHSICLPLPSSKETYYTMTLPMLQHLKKKRNHENIICFFLFPMKIIQTNCGLDSPSIFLITPHVAQLTATNADKFST